jgi:AGCS family alanine or glycine:cation symporter
MFWIVAVFVGSVMNLSLVWSIADSMNALMAIPNLIALLLLSRVLIKETKKYLWADNLDGDDPEEIPIVNKN